MFQGHLRYQQHFNHIRFLEVCWLDTDTEVIADTVELQAKKSKLSLHNTHWTMEAYSLVLHLNKYRSILLLRTEQLYIHTAYLEAAFANEISHTLSETVGQTVTGAGSRDRVPVPSRALHPGVLLVPCKPTHLFCEGVEEHPRYSVRYWGLSLTKEIKVWVSTSLTNTPTAENLLLADRNSFQESNILVCFL